MVVGVVVRGTGPKWGRQGEGRDEGEKVEEGATMPGWGWWVVEAVESFRTMPKRCGLVSVLLLLVRNRTWKEIAENVIRDCNNHIPDDFDTNFCSNKFKSWVIYHNSEDNR